MVKIWRIGGGGESKGEDRGGGESVEVQTAKAGFEKTTGQQERDGTALAIFVQRHHPDTCTYTPAPCKETRLTHERPSANARCIAPASKTHFAFGASSDTDGAPRASGSRNTLQSTRPEWNCLAARYQCCRESARHPCCGGSPSFCWAGVDGGFSLLCSPNRLAHSHKYSHTRRYASQATARLNTYGQSRTERLSGSPCSRPCSNQLPQRTPVSQRMQLHKVAG